MFRAPFPVTAIALVCVITVLARSVNASRDVLARDFARVLRERMTRGSAGKAACVTEQGTIPHGRTILYDDPCIKCRCNDGDDVCILRKCPVVRCVDAVTPPGRCCERCPNGGNCWLDDEVISATEPVIEHYHDSDTPGLCTRYCSCPTSDFMYHRYKGHTFAHCLTYCEEEEGDETSNRA